MKIYIIVVTYNRKLLLIDCLNSLIKQNHYFVKIIVVNNASTDGTISFLESNNFLNEKIELINLDENIGGAGGFSAGMQSAFEQGADYVWMMDDDAVPHSTALEEIMRHATPEHIYGSLAVNGEDTAWATILLAENKTVHLKNQVTELAEVQSLPFFFWFTYFFKIFSCFFFS